MNSRLGKTSFNKGEAFMCDSGAVGRSFCFLQCGHSSSKKTMFSC